MCVAVGFLPLTLTAGESGLGLRADFGILPHQGLSVNRVDENGQKGDSVVAIPQPTVQDLARGFIEQPNAVELKVVSNTAWVLLLSTVNVDMGTSDDGSYVKPIEDFQVRAGNRPYVSLSHEGQKLLSGPPGVFFPTLDYRTIANPDTYRPGTYSIEVVYMITSR